MGSVARTIASLDGHAGVTFADVSEALARCGSSGSCGMSSPHISDSKLPEEAYAVALASVPGIGPARLRRAVATGRPSVAWAWQQRRSGRSGADPHRSEDVRALWDRHRQLGITVLLPKPAYPKRLARDPRRRPCCCAWANPLSSTSRRRWR